MQRRQLPAEQMSPDIAGRLCLDEAHFVHLTTQQRAQHALRELRRSLLLLLGALELRVLRLLAIRVRHLLANQSRTVCHSVRVLSTEHTNEQRQQLHLAQRLAHCHRVRVATLVLR